ncbi:MAG: NUDIX hydrolase [Myxococcota bacterium]
MTTYRDDADLTRVLPWRTEPSRPLLETRIFTVHERVAASPQSDKQGAFVFIDSPDWVNVVALTPNDEVVMIEQYRHGLDRVTLEIPGGMVDPGESPLEAGTRELREETGYAGERAELIGRVSPNPAIQTNWCHTVRVRAAVPVGTQRLDGNEEIAVVTVPRADMRALISRGVIHHALVVAGLAHHLLG